MEAVAELLMQLQQKYGISDEDIQAVADAVATELGVGEVVEEQPEEVPPEAVPMEG